MLNRLLVKDFRCFEKAELELHPETTVLTGSNAQGKTSLIEALCVLMRLQSPRTSVRTDFIRFGAKSCLIEATEDEVKWRFAQSQSVRRLAMNDTVCGRSSEYLKNTARIVWMDHADMNLARGGAEHRRRYLDFAAAQLFPDYLPALKHYERALRSRNFLLKRDKNISWREVDAYGHLLDEHGRIIKHYRSELANRLKAPVTEAHDMLSGAVESATLSYRCGYEGDSLMEALHQFQREEERNRVTACGIHRDDLQLEINQRSVASFCSEGQQRTLCLALKLGQARILHDGRGEPPLLLMDDIFGELDKARRSALLSYLPKHTQKIITTTFMDWAQDIVLEAQIYEVREGKVH
ncbi:DNA replication/repair protein RecF [soil metagenome]